MIKTINEAINRKLASISFTNIITGKVESVSPLQIRINNRIVIGQNFIEPMSLGLNDYSPSSALPLVVGETVQMIRYNNGQRFYILGKTGTTKQPDEIVVDYKQQVVSKPIINATAEQKLDPVVIPIEDEVVLHKVSRTGSYTDLIDKPELAKVATSGRYEDLIGLPEIPEPGSGGTNDYNDLINKPIQVLVGTDKNPISARELESGVYILSGKIRMFLEDTTGQTSFSTPSLVVIEKYNLASFMEVFMPTSGEVWFFRLTDTSYMQIFNCPHQVGDIIVTNTNTNPQDRWTGTKWEMVNKEYAWWYVHNSKDDGEDVNLAKYVTSTENANIVSMSIVRNSNSIYIRIYFTNLVALTDSSIKLGQFNLNAIGLVEPTFLGIYAQTAPSDGGNGIAMVGVDTYGNITSNDVIVKGEGTEIPANSNFYFELVYHPPVPKMLDSHCGRFYWKRIS